jgi:Asp-tRNA(Asn)/Glu-tRNA(Gln) amidotransferase C subunit
MDAEERSAMDDLAEVATARQSMGVDQAGSEALTTATTENRTVREDETESSGLKGRISGAFD